LRHQRGACFDSALWQNERVMAIPVQSSKPEPVKIAVLPVAGLGTRFLPATKAVPKEMLTIVDRPVIQYAVDEARAAGIEEFVFVTGRNKGVIEDHFDRQYELESTLEARGRTIPLSELRQELPGAGQMLFTRQQQPLGLGHAVWCARHAVGNRPFALLLPDMVFQAGDGVLAQMMPIYAAIGGNVLAVEEVPPADVGAYGIVAPGAPMINGRADVFAINGMVEKPKPADAPSNLIISGRYILQPEIMPLLAAGERGSGGEIQLTDSMLALMKGQAFTGVRYQGRSFDCGSRQGFVAANLAFALDRPDMRNDLLAQLKHLLPNLAG
jgi:UTP--glucose-1-phosphate uridylyltransferase